MPQKFACTLTQNTRFKIKIVLRLATPLPLVYAPTMSTPTTSRMVADRVTIADTVVSAVKIHGPEIVPIVEKALFPNGPPANLRVADVLTALGAHLERTTSILVQADRDHTAELADDDAIRQARDSREVDLRDLLSTMRANLVRNYGSSVAGAYGFGATLPEDASGLLLLAGNVESLLRTRPLTETPKNKSLELAPLLAADDIRNAAATLRTALGDIDREKREAQLTQGAKNEAMDAWKAVYPAVADGVAAFFSLAGRSDLAQRVRPTARRRAGLPDESAPGPDTPSAQGEMAQGNHS